MKKNDGVSPVIGTILLVAITILLVATLSAVVMGMAGDIDADHVVGVTVVQGPDIDAINKSLIVTIIGGDTAGLDVVAVFGVENYYGNTLFKGIGVPMIFNGYDLGGDHVDQFVAGPVHFSVAARYPDGVNTLYMGTFNFV